MIRKLFPALLLILVLFQAGCVRSTRESPAPEPSSTAGSTPLRLLLEDSFEGKSFSGWEVDPGVSPTAVTPHAGHQSARLTGSSSLQRDIPTRVGQTYKVTAWLKIAAETGSDWGGLRVEVQDRDLKSLAHSGWLLQPERGKDWFKIAVRFTAATQRSRLLIGYFGGPGREMTVQVDEVHVFENGPNRLPEIHAGLTVPEAGSGPARLSYRLDGDDPDGAITHVEWDFGDGTRAFDRQGSHTAPASGAFTAVLRVMDDDGALVDHSFPWTAADPALPSITVREVPGEVSRPALALRGAVTGEIEEILISSDRGQVAVVPRHSLPEPKTWSCAIRLLPGWNRLLIQARDWSGRYATVERLVRFVPPGPLQVSAVRQSDLLVEQWEPLELSFNLINSAATHSDFPYAADLPAGLSNLDGVSVEGLFSADGWKTVYRRPGFLDQPFRIEEKAGAEWSYPQGSPEWRVRFSPPTQGEWQYRIEVREARGAAVSALGTFHSGAPTILSNHGPLQVARLDPRYFEFADGTPFLSGGLNLAFTPERFSLDALDVFDQIGSGNEEFFRWWLGGNIWGSAWQPWSSLTIGYSGYLPHTALSLDSAYTGGLAALRLDAGTPVMFQGWGSGHAGLVPGQKYRFLVRWRTQAVSGPAQPGSEYGLTLKFADWPQPGTTLGLPALIPHQTGDTPWHVSSADFQAAADYLPGLAILLENTTAGSAYVDQVGLYPVLADGRLGGQLLRGSQANRHLGFDPSRAAGVDAILREANRRGLYFKLVISEKDEYLLNHLGPNGLADPLGGHFFDEPGTPANWLHHAYWRYLSARYGAYRSVHSWELVNEASPSPGSPFRLAAELSDFAAADGNPHLATTSTWATLAEETWKSPDYRSIPYIDFHAYANPSETPQFSRDLAEFMSDYDRQAVTAAFGKPVVWGEMGVSDHPASSAELADLARDTTGYWLRELVWARTGPGGVYPLYWFPENILNHRLHPIFGAWNRFMDGIPLNNGRYQDAAVESSDPGLRILGQKDFQAGKAHLWIDNRRADWQTLTLGQSVPPVSGAVRIDMRAPQRLFNLTWYDPATGQPLRQEILTSTADGYLELKIDSLLIDTAVRIELQP